MANYKVAYGKKENMNLAIELGIIPPGCIILTEDSNEIFFYDLSNNLKTYEEKNTFDGYEEAEEWVESYDCKGQIISIHDGDVCTPYVVGYDNSLNKISGTDYRISDENPTDADCNYAPLTNWINAETEDVFVLTSVKDEKACWKCITKSEAQSYEHIQQVSSNKWIITHNLNKFPSVTVIDLAGQLIIGEISYIDKNILQIEFTSKISGTAYLN